MPSHHKKVSREEGLHGPAKLFRVGNGDFSRYGKLDPF